MEFILANWQLFAGVAVVSLLLLATGSGANLGGVMQLSPAEVVQAINQQRAVVFDLRSAESFAEGHLADSINITQEKIDAEIARLKKPAEQTVVLVSERGLSTRELVNQLKQAKVQQICELKGGVQAWRDEQLPLIKS